MMNVIFPQIIERQTLTAPLGLQFHDAATGAVVADNLEIKVRPANDDLRRRETRAAANRSGVFVAHRVSGLTDFGRGAGDERFWQDNASKKAFIVEVFDLENRFQAFQFQIELPVRGIYRWNSETTSPPAPTAPSIPLYSAPTRKIIGGQAVVRAELWDKNGNQPASFAVLEASFNNRLIARGIAGKDGKIALIFPELAAQSQPLSSPPASSTKIPLQSQFWNLEFAVKYEPTESFMSPPLESTLDSPDLPDLRLALRQRVGRIWADYEQTGELPQTALKLGAELVLRSSRAVVSSPDSPVSATDLSAKLFVSQAV